MSEELEQPIEATEPAPTEQPSVLGSAPTEPPVETDAPDYGALPASADDYSVELEGFDFAEFKADDENQALLKQAHEHGLTDKQLAWALQTYNSRAAELVNGASASGYEDCMTTLKGDWGDKVQENLGHANQAFSAAGISVQEAFDAGVANNPLVMKLAAHFGAQLKEDTPPINTQSTGAEDIRSLMSSEAYNDSKHPDHNRVYQKVSKYYELQNS